MTRVDDGSTKASKSEADEEDDDYPAANSLDLIKDRFLPFSCLLWRGVAWVARAALVRNAFKSLSGDAFEMRWKCV